MPAKLVSATIAQETGFRTECRAGNHLVVIDQPASGGGTDTGATPLEFQLFALGGCITAIGRIIANQRRLDIRGITVEMEGDLNTDGLLGKETPDRVGFTEFRARVSIDADMSDEEKAALVHEIDLRCPISDNLGTGAATDISFAG